MFLMLSFYDFFCVVFFWIIPEISCFYKCYFPFWHIWWQNMEEYDDKLAAVFSSLEKKIYRLKADVINRKFRHQPGRLEENIISCSQHSVLQSSQEEEELSQTFSQQTLRPSTYRWKYRHKTADNVKYFLLAFFHSL